MPYASGCKGCGVACDGSRCRQCKNEHNAQENKRRAAKRASGTCAFGACAKPVSSTKIVGGPAGKRVKESASYCREHLAYYAARQRAP